MSEPLFCRVCGAVVLSFALAGLSWAQTPQNAFPQTGISNLVQPGVPFHAGTGASPGQTVFAPATVGGRAGGAGMAGGAAMADFATLMNLIQTTIDPDSWLANGGNSSMLEYPAGVYVDPLGQLQLVRKAPSLQNPLLGAPSLNPRHPWRIQSKLRTISLRKLDQALLEFASHGLVPTSELRQLGGLSRIQYVQLDFANEDVLLVGPAGEAANGFELQDLALVTALVNAQTATLGCSIEPGHEALLAAQQMLSSSNAVKNLERNPKMFVEQLEQKIGPHRVRVFGMPANTATAVALVNADVHMKKVGFGALATRIPMDCYFDHLERQSDVPNQSLIRWWFSFADSPIHCNAERHLFELPPQCVAVLSEQQWVSQTGRAATGGRDPAADAFALGMTQQLSELRKTDYTYARLCAVFESALALQLGLEATGQSSWKAWFPALCNFGQLTNREIPEPRSVEGLTAWHRLKNGTTVAVVSGGVQISPRDLAVETKWHPSQFLATSVVPERPSRPSLAHASWWWD